ncbi:hypothetical protein M758_UG338000 [Ceratodon purpureus]|nr:hypothetical protein M758_UG338000 [Ceratodon purpureus]
MSTLLVVDISIGDYSRNLSSTKSGGRCCPSRWNFKTCVTRSSNLSVVVAPSIPGPMDYLRRLLFQVFKEVEIRGMNRWCEENDSRTERTPLLPPVYVLLL